MNPQGLNTKQWSEKAKMSVLDIDSAQIGLQGKRHIRYLGSCGNWHRILANIDPAESALNNKAASAKSVTIATRKLRKNG